MAFKKHDLDTLLESEAFKDAVSEAYIEIEMPLGNDEVPFSASKYVGWKDNTFTVAQSREGLIVAQFNLYNLMDASPMLVPDALVSVRQHNNKQGYDVRPIVFDLGKKEGFLYQHKPETRVLPDMSLDQAKKVMKDQLSEYINPWEKVRVYSEVDKVTSWDTIYQTFGTLMADAGVEDIQEKGSAFISRLQMLGIEDYTVDKMKEDSELAKPVTSIVPIEYVNGAIEPKGDTSAIVLELPE